MGIETMEISMGNIVVDPAFPCFSWESSAEILWDGDIFAIWSWNIMDWRDILQEIFGICISCFAEAFLHPGMIINNFINFGRKRWMPEVLWLGLNLKVLGKHGKTTKNRMADGSSSWGFPWFVHMATNCNASLNMTLLRLRPSKYPQTLLQHAYSPKRMGTFFSRYLQGLSRYVPSCLSFAKFLGHPGSICIKLCLAVGTTGFVSNMRFITNDTWRFPKILLPPNHHCNKPSSYWSTPHGLGPPISRMMISIKFGAAPSTNPLVRWARTPCTLELQTYSNRPSEKAWLKWFTPTIGWSIKTT